MIANPSRWAKLAAAKLPSVASPVWLYVILSVHAGMLAWSAAVHSPTIDEAMHLCGGLRRWSTNSFDVDIGNPPLVGDIAAVPVLFWDPILFWDKIPDSQAVGQDFLELNGSRSFWLITVARWACIGFSLIGANICYHWAKWLYGPHAALLSVILYTGCPSILANGALVTGDVASASLAIAGFYAFQRWLESPSWSRAVQCGLVLGLANIAKYVCVILAPTWILMWIIYTAVQWAKRQAKQPMFVDLLQWSTIGVVALIVINAGYRFQGPFRSINDIQVLSNSVSRYLPSAICTIPIPLPKEYVEGINAVAADRDPRHQAYLGGEWRQGGYWYFYLYGLIHKLPLGVIILVELAAFLTLFNRQYSAGWINEMIVLGAVVVFLSFVTLATSSQFARYSLPAVPFLLVWASKSGMLFSTNPRIGRLFVLPCVLFAIYSSMSVFPHSLSYFNELTLGSRRGDRYLIASDFDWGQDLLFLRSWVRDHPEVNNLHLAYFGKIDPQHAGITFTLPPKLDGSHFISGSSTNALEPQVGWYAVSSSLLRGGYWEVLPDGHGAGRWLEAPFYRYFLDLKPVATAGYSIKIYYIDAAAAAELRKAYCQETESSE